MHVLTLKSQAKTAQIAAANAVMLAQDQAQNVLVQWQGSEVLIFPSDTEEGRSRCCGKLTAQTTTCLRPGPC